MSEIRDSRVQGTHPSKYKERAARSQNNGSFAGRSKRGPKHHHERRLIRMLVRITEVHGDYLVGDAEGGTRKVKVRQCVCPKILSFKTIRVGGAVECLIDTNKKQVVCSAISVEEVISRR